MTTPLQPTTPTIPAVRPQIRSPPCMCLSQKALMQETVADELEEAYRSHVWDPNLRHVQKQKQGVTAARVELTSLFTKASHTWLLLHTLYSAALHYRCDCQCWLRCLVLHHIALQRGWYSLTPSTRCSLLFASRSSKSVSVGMPSSLLWVDSINWKQQVGCFQATNTSWKLR